MDDTPSAGSNTWARYVYWLTHRPGWDITKLADASGLARQTISDWSRGKKGRDGALEVANVMTLAKAAGEDPIQALMAAAGISAPPDTDDPEIRAVLEGGLPEEATKRIISDIYARRERDRERDMQGTQNTIELARLIEDQTAS